MNSTHETPDFIRMYLCLDKPYYENGRVPFFDDIGIGFTVGSIGGSFYHFLKAAVCTKTIPINSKFSAGINAARAHAPRLGAFWVLFTIATNLSSAAAVGVLGEQANRWIEGPGMAAGAAITWAPRGLGSATRASLAFGGVVGGHSVLSYRVLNDPDQFKRVNDYTYPYYRLHAENQQHE